MLFTMQTGVLKLQVCTDSIIRVTYAPVWPLPERKDYVSHQDAVGACGVEFASDDKNVTLSTSRLKVAIDRKEGLLSYTGADGKNLLAEGPKQMVPAVVNNEHTYHAEDVMKIYGSEEAFYGLGQHQAGVWNYRGESVDLSQDNTNILLCRCFFPAKAMAFSGTTHRPADSTIVSFITCSWVPKSRIRSITTFYMGPNSTDHRGISKTNRSRAALW